MSEVMTSIKGEVCDLGHLKAVMARHRPEIVIHMAAQALVTYSYQEPVETFTTNVLGTVNVLEAVRRSEGVRALIVVSSDKCYQDQGSLRGHRESEPMGGRDPYSSSKGCVELVVAAYRHSFFAPEGYTDHGVAVASVRAGNVIGGGDWSPDRLIPDVVKAFNEDRPVAVRNPNAVRPWQFVLEPLSGYLCLAENLYAGGSQFAEGWNFGPDDDQVRTVAWIVDHMARLWGDGSRWEHDQLAHPPEDLHLKVDSSKAKEQLAWSPKLSILTALEWTVEWYMGHREERCARDLVESQIERYEKILGVL